MTKTTRKNLMVKAFQTELANREKHNIFNKEYIRTERKMIGAVNNRGENLSCEQVRDYCNRWLSVIGEGGSKIVYGMDDIVIALHKQNIFYNNQIKKQVEIWSKIALTPEAVYFNPVLSYGLHRGDKLSGNDSRYINNSFVVSQKAKVFATIEECIRQMYILNKSLFNSTDVEYYRKAMESAIHKAGAGDIKAENIGLIYDYSEGEYRAVFIDYGYGW